MSQIGRYFNLAEDAKDAGVRLETVVKGDILYANDVVIETEQELSLFIRGFIAGKAQTK